MMNSIHRSLSHFFLVSILMMSVSPSPARAAIESGTIIVVDTFDDDLEDGLHCSLREAIRAANTDSVVDACPAGNGGDTVLLQEGTYTLSIVGSGENAALTGDLDILADVVIRSLGSTDLTVISALWNNCGINDCDRIFHVATYATVEFQSLTIQNGFAQAGPLGGGGIAIQNGKLTLRQVHLQGNRSEGVGGGMDNAGAEVVLFDSSFSGNEAKDGGGIFNSGSLSAYSSTLYGNTATIDPGGALDNRGTASLVNVTISGNSAIGGGIVSVGGGGIFSDGTLTLLNSSVVANSASDPLQGQNIASAYEIRFINTLVVNTHSGLNCSGDLKSLGNNLDSEDTCNFDQSTDLKNEGDQILEPLADNGGSTLTHALRDGSPAIDAGSDFNCTVKDQRGAFRPADGNGNGIANCDIGAYEYAGTFLTPVYLPVVVRKRDG